MMLGKLTTGLGLVAAIVNYSRAAYSKPCTISAFTRWPSSHGQLCPILRLKDESILVLFAGLDTTGRFLTALLCYMLMHPTVLTKLRSELQSLMYTSGETTHSQPTRIAAVSGKSRLQDLEFRLTSRQTAFINESLRLNCSMTGRFPRVTVEPMAYKDWVIPAGVGLIITSPYMC